MLGAQRHSRNMRKEATAAIGILRRRLFCGGTADFSIAATDSEVGSEGKPQPVTHNIFGKSVFVFLSNRFFLKLRFFMGVGAQTSKLERRKLSFFLYLYYIYKECNTRYI